MNKQNLIYCAIAFAAGFFVKGYLANNSEEEAEDKFNVDTVSTTVGTLDLRK